MMRNYVTTVQNNNVVEHDFQTKPTCSTQEMKSCGEGVDNSVQFNDEGCYEEASNIVKEENCL